MSSPAVNGVRDATELAASTPPPNNNSNGTPMATTPQGAPSGGALDELRRKMLFRQSNKQQAPPPAMNVNGELQPHPPGSPGRPSVSAGSGASIVGTKASHLNLDGSSKRGAGADASKAGDVEAEQMRSTLFQGRALPIRVISGGDLRTTEETQTADPHKLFQLLRKKKRATPHSSNKPFVPYQPPTADEGNGGAGASSQAESGAAHSGGGGSGEGGAPGGNSPISNPGEPSMHNTPPRPTGSIPSRRPTIGRKPSSDSISQHQHPESAPAGSSGQIIPPSAIVGGDHPERPTSRVSSANQLKREVNSAGLHGRPCTRQKHPSKSLDLFDSSSKKSDEELFPKRRSSSTMMQAPTPKAANGSNNNGITTVPSPSHNRQNGGGDEEDPHNMSSSNNNANAGNGTGGEKDDNVNFNCLFVQDEDEFGGEADAFPTAPSKQKSEIPLIETDWFTTDSWEPLACSDGHEVLECDTEDYAESLYELLKQSSTRKASFKK